MAYGSGIHPEAVHSQFLASEAYLRTLDPTRPPPTDDYAFEMVEVGRRKAEHDERVESLLAEAVGLLQCLPALIKALSQR